MKTILVVDDEPEIIRITRGYLESAGYKVLTANNGQSALAAFRSERPDLIVLDLNLPNASDATPSDGLDVARAIRQSPGTASTTPIIMLTARVDEMDRIIGLELGADDYVTKPFSPRELVARVRAVLRRGNLEDAGSDPLIRIGNLVVDPGRYEITLNGRKLDLTPTEFTLLKTLSSQPGRVFSRERLLDSLGLDYGGLERTVDSHIKNLRAKIEQNPRKPEYILTIFGVGYKFNDQF